MDENKVKQHKRLRIFFLCMMIVSFLLAIISATSLILDPIRTGTAERLTGYDECFANDYFNIFNFQVNNINVDCFNLDKYGWVEDYKVCKINVLPNKIIECKRVE